MGNSREGHAVGYVLLAFVVVCGAAEQGASIPGVELRARDSSLCLTKEKVPDLGTDFVICAFLQPLHQDQHQYDDEGADEGVDEGVDEEDEEEEEEDEEEGYQGISDPTIFTLNMDGVVMRASVSPSSQLQVQYGNTSYAFDETLVAGVWRRVCVYTDAEEDKVGVKLNLYLTDYMKG
ncbi:uncharacterized protein LOC121856068 [Homarus americanus]|uniref:uncharacterized protein LOC121856068 n=1 Tax=Homarus americanus TaxID=6706 RepID=UPI001C48AC67|nr:uncharacterized protein LOC121856068 [Homarus americanus]